MHEFSTAVGVVETVLDVARQNNAIKVKKIELVVGEFTMLNDDQLKFSFEIASEGTIAEGAEVIIKKQKGEIECLDCQYKGEIADREKKEELDHFVVDLVNIFECPKCKGPMIFRWERTIVSEIPELYLECLSCGLRIFNPKTDAPPLKDKVIACYKLPEIPTRVSLDETGR